MENYREGRRHGKSSGRTKVSGQSSSHTPREPQTARLSRQHVQELRRGHQRDSHSQLHGEGGVYDTSFYNEAPPVIHEFFPQTPEGIASHSYYGTGSASYNTPDFNTLSLFDASERRGEIYGNTSDYGHPHQTGYEPHTSNHQTHVDFLNEHERAIEQYQRSLAQYEADHGHHPPPQEQAGIIPVDEGEVDTQEVEIQPGHKTLVWQYRDDEARENLFELVSKYRGLRPEQSQESLSTMLTVSLENALSSHTPLRVDKALRTLWPRHLYPLQPVWMNGVLDIDCNDLVEDLSFITGQSKFAIRDYFLQSQMKPDMTRMLINNGPNGLIIFAQSTGLGLDKDVVGPHGEMLQQRDNQHVDAPWKFGITGEERAYINNLVINTCQKSSMWAFLNLNAPRIPKGFGKALLAAEKENTNTKFLRLIDLLENIKPIPSWYHRYYAAIKKAEERA
ncbi:hypothetical protein CBS101457_000281 [Exobasidium rhododendri]|nr:hypothetical protein CBS101457_000281 [Exobasidium rhododendri]